MEKHGSNLSFPPVYKDADLVATFEGIACYSDKETSQIEGSSVTFKDGSTADMKNRSIEHKGVGKILLKTLNDSFIAEHTVT